MHWLDSTILAVLAAAAILGAYTGLLMQVFRLVGFAVALYAATCLHPAAVAWLSENLMRGAEPQACTAVAFGAIFLGIYLAIFLATLLLERGLRATQLQYLNRCFGALLGAAKMGLLIGAIAFGVQQLRHQQATQLLEESFLAPMLARGVEQTLAALPADYLSDWSSGWNQLREALPSGSGKTTANPPALDSITKI